MISVERTMRTGRVRAASRFPPAGGQAERARASGETTPVAFNLARDFAARSIGAEDSILASAAVSRTNLRLRPRAELTQTSPTLLQRRCYPPAFAHTHGR